MSVSSTNSLKQEGELLVVHMAEQQTGNELRRLKNYIVKLAEEQGREINILVDVSQVKKSDEGANSFAKVFFKGLPFRHMAVYGGSRAVNVGIRLVLNLFMSPGVGEVKLFKTEAKARHWLENIVQ